VSGGQVCAVALLMLLPHHLLDNNAFLSILFDVGIGYFFNHNIKFNIMELLR
jgi:hypothetical protein